MYNHDMYSMLPIATFTNTPNEIRISKDKRDTLQECKEWIKVPGCQANGLKDRSNLGQWRLWLEAYPISWKREQTPITHLGMMCKPL